MGDAFDAAELSPTDVDDIVSGAAIDLNWDGRDGAGNGDGVVACIAVDLKLNRIVVGRRRHVRHDLLRRAAVRRAHLTFLTLDLVCARARRRPVTPPAGSGQHGSGIAGDGQAGEGAINVHRGHDAAHPLTGGPGLAAVGQGGEVCGGRGSVHRYTCRSARQRVGDDGVVQRAAIDHDLVTGVPLLPGVDHLGGDARAVPEVVEVIGITSTLAVQHGGEPGAGLVDVVGVCA